MDQSSALLIGTAAGLGFAHTLIGLDHSLPFVVLARSQRWSFKKLLGITTLCGAGHLLSSILIGTIGLLLGVGLRSLTSIEESRAGFAAWLLIAFGFSYMVWGIYGSMRGRKHSHVHAHDDGTVHAHEHNHRGEHSHAHVKKGAQTMTVLGLVVVFVLGPCEVLIPLLLAPAFEAHWYTVLGVVGAFSGATLVTMLSLVSIGYYGMRWRGFDFLERHMHAMAGFVIAVSGLAIELLGI